MKKLDVNAEAPVEVIIGQEVETEVQVEVTNTVSGKHITIDIHTYIHTHK